MSTAIGFHNAPPARAIGASPRTVVAEVNRIGRRRFSDAATMAFRKGSVSRSMSIWSISTMALLMMMPDRLMMPSVPKNESGCPVASSPKGMPIRINGMLMKVRSVRRNRIELQDDRKHHHGERNRKAGCQLLVCLRAFLDLAADGHVITAAHVHLIEPGLDGFQQVPGGHRGAAGGDRDRPFLVLAPDPGEIEPGR